MKTPEQEFIAQIMFLSGMGCGPLALTFAIIGAVCKKLLTAVSWFVAAALAFTHFLWYFDVLGGALSAKVGTYEPSPWISFLPYSAIGAGVLTALWVWFDRCRKQHPEQL